MGDLASKQYPEFHLKISNCGDSSTVVLLYSFVMITLHAIVGVVGQVTCVSDIGFGALIGFRVFGCVDVGMTSYPFDGTRSLAEICLRNFWLSLCT